MPEVQVRKKFTAVEEIFHEGGPVSSRPRRRAAALAVIHNPFAGSYVKEIAGFMDDLKPPANWSTAPCGMCPEAMPCAKLSATLELSWRLPKR